MKIRSLMSLMMASFLLAPSASALSCVQPDIIRDLNRAKDSESVYHIFVGTFSFDSTDDGSNSQPRGSLYMGTQSPDGDVVQLKPLLIGPQSLQASFSGYSLASHQHQDISLGGVPVAVETSCAGPWCGTLPKADREIIAFVKASQTGAPILTMGACGGMAYDYTPARLDRLRQCIEQDCAAPL